MLRRSTSRVADLLIRGWEALAWRSSGQAPVLALLLVGGVGGLGVAPFGVPTPGQTELRAATARQAPSPDADAVEPVLRTYCMGCLG